MLLSVLAGTALALPADLLDPFAVRNQSPVIQVCGLPVWYGNGSLKPGEWEALVSRDVASHFFRNSNDPEYLLFDGESDRFALALRRRF